MNRYFMFALIALLVFPMSVAAAPNLPAIDKIATQFLGESTPGLGVLVTRQGQVLHIGGYGFADIDRQTSVTDQSIFDLASVSKQMTALAAHLQIQDGLYRPDTPVIDILPQLRGITGAEEMRVADLIYHASGLPDYLDWDDYGADKSNNDVLEWLASQEMQDRAGTVFNYSNTGYVVLGSLIAAAEGQRDLAAVLQARVWGPLGMADTSLPSARDPSRRVSGYAGQDGDFAPSRFPDQAQGDGNVHASLRDMARYEAAFWNSGFLPNAAGLFQTGQFSDGSQITDEGAGYGYGYGWALSLDGEYADHSGGWAGTSTYYLRNLITGVSVVLLANGEDADLGELAEQIEAALP